jgi:hypothetical protein
MVSTKIDLVLYRAAYYAGAPINRNTIETLVVRYLSELIGADYNGYTHAGLKLQSSTETYHVELCEDGVCAWSYLLDYADYIERVLHIPLHVGSIHQHEEYVTYDKWAVTNKALLQKLLGTPVTGFICTDYPEHVIFGSVSHLSTRELVDRCMCDGVVDVQELVERSRKQCLSFSTTPNVPNVGQVTMWQFMFMGVVSALGAGHLIRKVPFRW